jgi:hypothetical protein
VSAMRSCVLAQMHAGAERDVSRTRPVELDGLRLGEAAGIEGGRAVVEHHAVTLADGSPCAAGFPR